VRARGGNAPSARRSTRNPGVGARGANEGGKAVRRFALLFVLFASIGFALIFAPPIEPRIGDLTRSIAAASAAIIRLAGGRVEVAGDLLTAPGTTFSMKIVNGCNGINVIVLLWSALLAWPAGSVDKLKGMVLGALVIQAANTVRVITLFYLGQWNTAWFDWMHLYVWEILIMIVGVSVFAGWIRRIPAGASPDPAR
jgi:exosortase H (IPTLxxWG-CTERM-specific)